MKSLKEGEDTGFNHKKLHKGKKDENRSLLMFALVNF